MTNPMISRLVLTAALVATSAGTAQAQWDYKTDVKRQISIYAMSCSGCDLTGKDYSGTKMKNSNLSAAILNRVNLSGGTIYNSDFSGAHLKKAFLVSVKGDKVIFRGANLNNSTLTEIELKESDLSGATLSGAEVRKAKISHSNLRQANLGRINALGSTLTDNDFSRARFDGANLTGSALTNSVFVGTNFGRSELTAVSLDGANLSGAKMAMVDGLTQEQLDSACGDGNTELPVNLTISYCVDVEGDSKVHDLADHHEMAARDQEIILRTERALRQTENLMKLASPEARKALQRVHADLLAIQRTVEK